MVQGAWSGDLLHGKRRVGLLGVVSGFANEAASAGEPQNVCLHIHRARDFLYPGARSKLSKWLRTFASAASPSGLSGRDSAATQAEVARTLQNPGGGLELEHASPTALHGESRCAGADSAKVGRAPPAAPPAGAAARAHGSWLLALRATLTWECRMRPGVMLSTQIKQKQQCRAIKNKKDW